MTTRDPYLILGVSRSASQTEIRKAFLSASLRHHPDKVQGSARDKQQSEELFKITADAYEQLKEASARGDGGYAYQHHRSSTSHSVYTTNSSHLRRPAQQQAPNSGRFKPSFTSAASEAPSSEPTAPKFRQPQTSPRHSSSGDGTVPGFGGIPTSARSPSARTAASPNALSFATPSRPRSCAQMEEPLPSSEKNSPDKSSKKKAAAAESEQQQQQKKPSEEQRSASPLSPESLRNSDSSSISGYALSPDAMDALSRLKRRHEAAQQFAKQTGDSPSSSPASPEPALASSLSPAPADSPPVPPKRARKNPSAWVEELFKKQNDFVQANAAAGMHSHNHNFSSSAGAATTSSRPASATIRRPTSGVASMSSTYNSRSSNINNNVASSAIFTSSTSTAAKKRPSSPLPDLASVEDDVGLTGQHVVASPPPSSHGGPPPPPTKSAASSPGSLSTAKTAAEAVAKTVANESKKNQLPSPRRPFSAGIRWGEGSGSLGEPPAGGVGVGDDSGSFFDDEIIVAAAASVGHSLPAKEVPKSEQQQQSKPVPEPPVQHKESPPPHTSNSSSNSSAVRGTFLVPADEVIATLGRTELQLLIEQLQHKLTTASTALRSKMNLV